MSLTKLYPFQKLVFVFVPYLVSRGGQGVKGEVVGLLPPARWREELAVRGRDPVGLEVVGDSDARGLCQLEESLSHVAVGSQRWVVVEFLHYGLQHTYIHAVCEDEGRQSVTR